MACATKFGRAVRGTAAGRSGDESAGAIDPTDPTGPTPGSPSGLGPTLGLGRVGTRPWLPAKLRSWGKAHRFGHQFDRRAGCSTSAAVLSRSRLFLSAWCGMLAWGLEGVSLSLIACEVGVPITFTTGIGIYAIAVLAGALSFLPGGLGSTEAVMGVPGRLRRGRRGGGRHHPVVPDRHALVRCRAGRAGGGGVAFRWPAAKRSLKEDWTIIPHAAPTSP